MTAEHTASVTASLFQAAMGAVAIAFFIRAWLADRRRTRMVEQEEERSRAFHERVEREMKETGAALQARIRGAPYMCPHCGSQIRPSPPTPEA